MRRSRTRSSTRRWSSARTRGSSRTRVACRSRESSSRSSGRSAFGSRRATRPERRSSSSSRASPRGSPSTSSTISTASSSSTGRRRRADGRLSGSYGRRPSSRTRWRGANSRRSDGAARRGCARAARGPARRRLPAHPPRPAARPRPTGRPPAGEGGCGASRHPGSPAGAPRRPTRARRRRDGDRRGLRRADSRGAAPVERAIMAGDRETGVTIHRTTAELDAGPIAAQRSFPIAPDDDAGTVYARAGALAAELLEGVLSGTPGFRPQSEEGVTYAERLTAVDRELDWSRPPEELLNRIRALSPHIGARGPVDGKLLTVWRAQPVGPDAALTADGLELLEVQPEGRRRMTGEEYLRGLRG